MLVKYTAFLPDSNGELSVFGIDGLSEDQIWELAEVIERSARNVYGRGEIMVINAAEYGLVVEPDNTPPRHANIIGWPQDKGQQMYIAQRLAGGANLIMRSK